MAPDATMPAPATTIGQRIRAKRKLRRWSVRQLAELSGISIASLSRIETGKQSADNRHTLAAIAQALQVPQEELTGQPATPTDLVSAETEAAIHATVGALIESDPEERPSTSDPRTLDQLAEEYLRLQGLRQACDYATAVRLIPRLLRDVHAHVHGQDRAAALRLLALTGTDTTFVVRNLGHPAESWVAAERVRDAARALDDPVIHGLAAWARGHAATSNGAYARALRLAESGIEAMREAKGEGAVEMRAMLHLLASWTCYALGKSDDALPALQFAEAVARETGDSNTFGLAFGPANIGVWKINMATDAHEPAKALELAPAVAPSALPTSRQTSFYIDLARALASLRKDEQATRMMLRAERLGPQRLKNSPFVAETVRVLHERSRQSDPTGIHGLAQRMGIDR